MSILVQGSLKLKSVNDGDDSVSLDVKLNIDDLNSVSQEDLSISLTMLKLKIQDEYYRKIIEHSR